MKRTESIIIYPVHRQFGYKAPGIVVDVTDINPDMKYSFAKTQAENRSRLSAFADKWYFI